MNDRFARFVGIRRISQKQLGVAENVAKSSHPSTLYRARVARV